MNNGDWWVEIPKTICREHFGDKCNHLKWYGVAFAVVLFLIWL